MATTSIGAGWPSPQAAGPGRSNGPGGIQKAAVAASVVVLGALAAIEVTVGHWAYTYLIDARSL